MRNLIDALDAWTANLSSFLNGECNHAPCVRPRKGYRDQQPWTSCAGRGLYGDGRGGGNDGVWEGQPRPIPSLLSSRFVSTSQLLPDFLLLLHSVNTSGTALQVYIASSPSPLFTSSGELISFPPFLPLSFPPPLRSPPKRPLEVPQKDLLGAQMAVPSDRGSDRGSTSTRARRLRRGGFLSLFCFGCVSFRSCIRSDTVVLSTEE